MECYRYHQSFNSDDRVSDFWVILWWRLPSLLTGMPMSAIYLFINFDTSIRVLTGFELNKYVWDLTDVRKFKIRDISDSARYFRMESKISPYFEYILRHFFYQFCIKLHPYLFHWQQPLVFSSTSLVLSDLKAMKWQISWWGLPYILLWMISSGELFS